MNEPVERDLVERIRQGDPEAVAEFYRHYWRAARAFAYGITADLASAEDAAADGLQAALASLQKLRDPQRLGPWLRTIVVRSARHQRSRRAEVQSQQLSPASGQATPQDRIERRELALQIREAVDRLPAQYREAISLHYFEGYPIAQAARFLGVPPGTLKRRLCDGRRRLKRVCLRILEGSNVMTSDADLAERIDRLLARGGDSKELLEVWGLAVQQRPYPYELLHKLAKGYLGPRLTAERWDKTRERILQALHEHGQASPETSIPTHPLGQAVLRIVEAFPGFDRWEITPEEVMNSLVARYRPDAPLHSRFLLPPGFAEGHSGSYLRLARGVVFLDENGGILDVMNLLHRANEAKPGRFARRARLSNIIEVTWMEARPLELREVELRLTDLAEKVLPGMSVRFTPSNETRYRSALRMQLGECARPAGTGGVVQEWPGMAEGTSTAHIRLYLETWASIMSGAQIEFQHLPVNCCQSV